MQKKLTITVSEEVYEGLYDVIGPRRISRFIEDVIRPYVVQPNLEEGYRMMARDEEHEAAALEWTEAMIGDVANETW